MNKYLQVLLVITCISFARCDKIDMTKSMFSYSLLNGKWEFVYKDYFLEFMGLNEQGEGIMKKTWTYNNKVYVYYIRGMTSDQQNFYFEQKLNNVENGDGTEPLDTVWIKDKMNIEFVDFTTFIQHEKPGKNTFKFNRI